MSEETTAPATADGESGDEADAIARAVREVAGVSDLHAGVLGEVTNLLPGRSSAGVRLRDQGCEVHLVLERGAEIEATTNAVREAVRALVPGQVDVIVEDVVPASEASATNGAG